MNPQIKDHFYDDFLREPTKDNFQKFMCNVCLYPEAGKMKNEIEQLERKVIKLQES